ncbi:MAG: two pore domain potassium channel family protein [Okeania sp. SIO1H6]|nr:two pore domain potassium channel family protein [Okeania sp. SIO4D6]NEP42778.1 two pore domain potassium channel family protein [Okeania sp. SIO2H7]NEP73113.1 two pore domain potassium channel family protein [Okeania sp. SIO2G5]NEP93936.1 two pore domain potassium channel family protein [Okeania sp. SIO2F5]NEQ92579.1 two pore domain potassium channel family protein [Okeania sp. SIO2G4]NES76417.1 two pore domain potassium channel family protein [Okeania sp. SIO1H4]NET16323.1 two pore domai
MIQEPKTWTSSERTRSIFLFLWKFLSYLGMSALFISLGLMMGIIGYHWVAGLSWIDSLVEASMILSGMGPISPLSTTSAKVFASVYALFSGLVFVIAMGILLSPLVYSLLSQFRVHLNNENYQQDEQLAK